MCIFFGVWGKIKKKKIKKNQKILRKLLTQKKNNDIVYLTLRCTDIKRRLEKRKKKEKEQKNEKGKV